MEGSHVPMNITLDANGRFDQDLICVECSYNLRGLEPTEQCPECGRPTKESMRQNLLRHGDRWWLQRVAVGSRLAFHGWLWLTLLPIAYGVLGFTTTNGFSDFYFLVLNSRIAALLPLVSAGLIALAAATLTGLWLIGEPDPSGCQTGTHRPLAAKLTQLFVPVAGVSWYWAFCWRCDFCQWLPALAVAASMLAWASCACVMAGLAGRMAMVSMQRHLAILAKLVMGLTVPAVLFFALEAMMTSSETMDLSRSWGIEQVAPFVGIGTLSGWIGVQAWYLVLLGRFSKNFRTIAKEVRSQLNGHPGKLDWLQEAYTPFRREIIHGLQSLAVAFAGCVALELVAYTWLVASTWDAGPTGVESMRILQSLAGLAAICAAFGATAGFRPADAMPRPRHRLRKISRITLVVHGLLGVFFTVTSPAFIPQMDGVIDLQLSMITQLLAIAGWTTLNMYLLSLAHDLQSAWLVRLMRLAVWVSPACGMLWFYFVFEPQVLKEIGLVMMGRWPNVGEWEPWPDSYVLAAQIAWQISLIAPALLMCRDLCRTTGRQRKIEPVPSGLIRTPHTLVETLPDESIGTSNQRDESESNHSLRSSRRYPARRKAIDMCKSIFRTPAAAVLLAGMIIATAIAAAVATQSSRQPAGQPASNPTPIFVHDTNDHYVELRTPSMPGCYSGGEIVRRGAQSTQMRRAIGDLKCICKEIYVYNPRIVVESNNQKEYEAVFTSNDPEVLAIIAKPLELVVTQEEREMQVLAIWTAPEGHRLKPAAERQQVKVEDVCCDIQGRWPLDGATMDDLARFLERSVYRPVVNLTTLSGRWSILLSPEAVHACRSLRSDQRISLDELGLEVGWEKARIVVTVVKDGPPEESKPGPTSRRN